VSVCVNVCENPQTISPDFTQTPPRPKNLPKSKTAVFLKENGGFWAF